MKKMIAYDFLKENLRKDKPAKEDTFVSAPLYYLLTGRKGAWVYKGNKSILIIAIHPQVEKRLLVFPEIGKADYELTASVLATLTPPENGIQLARHTEEELTTLKRQLARQTYMPVSGIEIHEERSLDWRYPVRILDTTHVAEMKGPRFEKIRHKFRAAVGIEVLPLHSTDALRSLRAALKFWEGNMIAKGKDEKDMCSFYEELFKVLKENPESAHGLLFKQGKRPVGFSIWDEPYAQTANLMSNLGDTSITGLAEFQLVSVCKHLSEQGILYLNRGGSEHEGLDSFKAKFNPAKTVKILSADVLYRRAANDGIETTVIVAPSP